MINISENTRNTVKEAEAALAPVFADFDETAKTVSEKILSAFADNRVSEAHLHGTTGYGYDDRGRDTLEKIYAQVMGCEAALVRSCIVSGTHALAIGLFGLLRPNDVLLSVTGKPYDTLDEVIGIEGTSGNGSLKDFGVYYEQIDMTEKGYIDLDAVNARLVLGGVKVVFIQRSKGYAADRRTLSVEEIGELSKIVHRYENVYLVVDNCYGEFVQTTEPVYHGADLQIGSLIKNPGGGLCRTGGYLAGTAKAVELCSYRLTSPGIGSEVGASLDENRNMYQGLFFAPAVVASALKCAALASYLFSRAGFKTTPAFDEKRYDIIQTVDLGCEKNICAFCRGIQAGSPIDSYVTPEPWDMPGYTDRVVMAAGTFTSGASIELSADAPIRPPYTVYFQGGLTYETGRIGIMRAYDEVMTTK